MAELRQRRRLPGEYDENEDNKPVPWGVSESGEGPNPKLLKVVGIFAAFLVLMMGGIMIHHHLTANYSLMEPEPTMATVDTAVFARRAIKDLIAKRHCQPILIRLAWHDAGTFDKDARKAWPKPGGATASIRFQPELMHGANAGLSNALALLTPIKNQFPDLSWADLIQLASAVAVQESGGPLIPLRLGRLDAPSPDDCTPDGRLPAAGAPFPDRSGSPAEHLRHVFYRMGLSDQDIVALSGAHTLGRARPERSGWGKESTQYTERGPGSPGGQSWTREWLKFDNSYFRDIKEKRDEDLLVLPTDAALFEDEAFRTYAELYASDQNAFFNDYVAAHLRLSELGVRWQEGGPITLPAEE